MRVRWSRRATRHLNSFRNWLGTSDGANPKRTSQRIKDSAALLERFGDIGRPNHQNATRELSVRGAPYVIVYVDKDDHFLIVAVYHTAQSR